jgi:hypothetical protein
VDDRAGLHCVDLVEHLEAECRAVELNREPPVRVVHHLDLLAHQALYSRSSPATKSCEYADCFEVERDRVGAMAGRYWRAYPDKCAEEPFAPTVKQFLLAMILCLC